MADPHKLRVKVGAHEFEAEGTQESVTAQFEAWKALISAPAQASPPKPSRLSQVVEEVRTKDGMIGATWDIYEVDDKRKLVTIKVHPTGDQRDADAVLLILWGYLKALQQSEVRVTQLMESMRVSGLTVGRLDRAIAPYRKEGFVLKGGKGKGGTYRLTHTGSTRAEDLARVLFEQLV